jgi:hypothetical protein
MRVLSGSCFLPEWYWAEQLSGHPHWQVTLLLADQESQECQIENRAAIPETSESRSNHSQDHEKFSKKAHHDVKN